MTSCPTTPPAKGSREWLELAGTCVCVSINNSLLCSTELFPSRASEYFREFSTVGLVPMGAGFELVSELECGVNEGSLTFESLHSASSSVSHFASEYHLWWKVCGILTWTAVSPGGIDGRGTSQLMANSNGLITVILWTVSGQLLRHMTSPLSRLCLLPEKHMHVRWFPSNVADSILTSLHSSPSLSVTTKLSPKFTNTLLKTPRMFTEMKRILLLRVVHCFPL